MFRYIILVIFIITLISLLSLFEEPTVNQYHPIPNRETETEKAEERKGPKKIRKMVHIQSDMDFLMDAYGVGGS